MELVIRCEYGSIIPWVRRLEDGRHTAVAELFAALTFWACG